MDASQPIACKDSRPALIDGRGAQGGVGKVAGDQPAFREVPQAQRPVLGPGERAPAIGEQRGARDPTPVAGQRRAEASRPLEVATAR